MEPLWEILLHKDKNKKLVASPVKTSKVVFLNFLPSPSHFIFLLSNQCWKTVLQNNSISPRFEVLNYWILLPSQSVPPAHILCKENKCILLPRNGLCNSIYGSANYHFQILRISFLFTNLSLWEVVSFFFFWGSDIKGIKSTNKRCWKVRWADQACHFCHILSLSLPSVWEFETQIWSSQIAVQYMAMTSSEDLSNGELLFLNKDNPYH